MNSSRRWGVYQLGYQASLFVTLILLADHCALGQSRSPIAQALDWYSVWHADNTIPSSAQTCQGELLDNNFEFRCDPMAVVVSGEFDESGRCSIIFMRRSVTPDDGLRLRPRIREVVQTPRQECGELPIESRHIRMSVTPQSRMPDPALSVRARDTAMKYFKRAGGSTCTLRFPIVKTGDPFVHVYEECRVTVSDVWEFRVHHGQMADFAHWTYSRGKKDLPAGVAERRKRMDLWFER